MPQGESTRGPYKRITSMHKSFSVVQESSPVRPDESSMSGSFDAQNLINRLTQELSCQTGFILSILPRGSLQIVQPATVPEALLKSYARDFHAQDRVAWEAIIRQQAVRALDCWPQGQFDTSPFITGFLRANGLRFVLAAPLVAPVLDGYAGAVEVYRTQDQGPFNSEDQRKLMGFA